MARKGCENTERLNINVNMNVIVSVIVKHKRKHKYKHKQKREREGKTIMQILYGWKKMRAKRELIRRRNPKDAKQMKDNKPS